MRYKASAQLFALVALFTVSGCPAEGQPETEEGYPAGTEDIAEASSRIENLNSLVANSLDLNALDLNALDLNALDLNAMSPGALGSIHAPGSSGDLAREALRYMVSCALTDSQSFSFHWTDGSNVVHYETYGGTLGLASAWVTRSLSMAERRWISACMISRVNWYLVPVMLSSRGSKPPLNHTSIEEASAHSVLEGAFWGDLFGATPTAYSCNTPSNIDAARARMRDCAAGHLENNQTVDCGIIHVVGPCETSCDALMDGDKLYYPGCSADSSYTTSVITVWLAQ